MTTSRLPQAVFVDTSGWAESVLGNTSNHLAMEAYARQLFADEQRTVVTTDDVLNEVVALLTATSRGVPRPKIIGLINSIRNATHVRIIHVDASMWDAAWAMLEQFTDKSWSLVDATSFIVMRQLGISEAFTSDQHFAQAGFMRVP